MGVFNLCDNFQITHGEAGVKGNVGLWLSYLTVKAVEYDILSLLFDDFLVGMFSEWVVNEGTVLYILDWLYLEFDRFEFCW